MLLARHHDPIVAIATAPGRGAVGIVRASGPNLESLIQALCHRTLQARRASVLEFLDEHGEAIDRGLAIWFPAPHSYTGEDVLELQAHGGAVVLQLLLARCLQAGAHIGLRVAEPGEFTQRAFLNDKLDLAQAEAVADLIDASTEAAARSASRSLAGAFSSEINALRDALIALRTLVEATLDFPEEEIDFLQRANARERLAAIAASIDTVLDRARLGSLLREGIRVVIAGLPNVGKSSLLNALAGAELAIVTPIAGTTRDKVSQTIQIEGVPLHVTDTAGLRPDPGAADEVERIGIERAWDAIEDADAVLFVHDLTRLGDAAYDAEEAAIAARLAGVEDRLVHVYNKSDLGAASNGTPNSPPDGAPDGTPSSTPARTPARTPRRTPRRTSDSAPAGADIVLSARTGAGLADLRARLLARAGWHAQPEGVFIARTRHVHALQRAQARIVLAAALLDQPQPALELLAEELRLAHEALGEITGQFSVDDLLGEIFGRFCIGK